MKCVIRLICWNCSMHSDQITSCPYCNKIIPIKEEEVNYGESLNIPNCKEKQKITFFDLFGLDIMEDISNKKLNQLFRNMICAMHPDIYTSQIEKEIALVKTSIYNTAYKTISSFIQRIDYICKLLDIEKQYESLDKKDHEYYETENKKMAEYFFIKKMELLDSYSDTTINHINNIQEECQKDIYRELYNTRIIQIKLLINKWRYCDGFKIHI